MTAPERTFVVTPFFQLANAWAAQQGIPRRSLIVVTPSCEHRLRGVGNCRIVVIEPSRRHAGFDRLRESVHVLEATDTTVTVERVLAP